MNNSRYYRIYQALYFGTPQGKDALTTGELIQSLKILTDKINISITLIGSHGLGGESKGGDNESGGEQTIFPQELLGKIAEDIKRCVREQAGKTSGYSSNLYSVFMEILWTHISIRKALLQKFTTKRKVDKFKEIFHTHRIATSPIPIRPSKRDLVMLSAGIYPFYFHNEYSQPRTQNKGLAIYLDVSGSVNEYLPKIIGVLASLRKEITTIFQFSNKVVETKFESLLKGKIETTYGTDFDCIAKPIIEKGFDKAIVITDGYAYMHDDLKTQLHKLKPAILTILFSDAQTCEDLEEFGDVVFLEDITT